MCRKNRAIERQCQFSTQRAGQIVTQVQTELCICASQGLFEVRVGSADGAENIIQHERGLFRNEGDRRAGVGGNIVHRTHGSWSRQPGGHPVPLPVKFQGKPVISLTGRLTARRDQILDVVQAAVPKRLRLSLLRMHARYNLAEIRSNQGLRTSAVDVRNALPKIRLGEKRCSGTELRAHLPNRGGVTTDKQSLGSDQHYHAALIATQRRERLRVYHPQIARALSTRQSVSKVLLQVILQSGLAHFG